MVFTDPPYNVPIRGHVGGLGRIQHREFVMASGEMSTAAFTTFLRDALSLCASSSIDGALHFVCMDWGHLRELLAAADDVYTEQKNLCVWAKDNAGMGSLYRSQHELVALFKAGTAPHRNNVELGRHGRNRTNVWRYPGVNSFGRKGEEEHLSYHYKVLGEERAYPRSIGEALHPAREPLATLEEIRRNIGEYVFVGQYQQAPAPREGGMVKRGWFQHYGMSERPESFEMVLQSWDTANKASELSDYSVCTTWGLSGTRIYLLHVLRKKLDYPSLKRAVCEQADLHQAEVVLIEDKASGTQLIQELSQDGMHSVKPYRPDGGMNKQMRMNAQTGVIENGLVFLPAVAEWLEAYLHEMTTFPAGKHDDQVDSTAQALHWIKMGKIPEPGIYAYYRQMAEEQGITVPAW